MPSTVDVTDAAPARLRAGDGLIVLTVALLAIGVVMVASAGMVVQPTGTTGLADVLGSRASGLAAAAIVALVIGARIDVLALYRLRGLSSPIPWLVLLALGALVAVHLPGIGHSAKGATRWLDLGFIRVQASEIAKWSLPMILAWHGARRAAGLGRLGPGFVAPMILVGVICALIAVEDLGTAVLVGMVATCLLVAAGVRLWQALLLLPLAALGFVAAVLHSPYRMRRLTSFVDPYQDPTDAGYQMIQSMAAVSGGGLAGRGLGNGLQKFGYLPEDTTDFIFAIVCEEIGVVGAAMILGLYAALLSCGWSIVRRCAEPFGKLLALGIVLTIGLQAAINLFVVTGLAPTKGIALPLVSSGGSGWVLTAFSIGLLVSLDRGLSRTPPVALERSPA